MMRKVIALILVLIFMSAQHVLATDEAMVNSFSEGWTFWSDTNSERTTVSIPHDAMQTETRSSANVDGFSMGYFPGNIYHYEKQFEVSSDMLTRHVTIQFEGVWQRSKVYINNKVAGGCAYGYSAFTVCADGFLREGTNTIRVDADNSQVPNSRWYTGAGIFRPVHLIIQEQTYIKDVRITTKSISPAVINVQTETYGGKVRTTILYGGSPVASSDGTQADIVIPDAHLWSADHPHLYQVRTELLKDGRVIETQTHDFGIRQIDWSTKGFFVNGEPVLLKGGCLHHDNGILGACEYDEAADRRIRLLKEYGFNAIRSAHNPCSEAVLKACDKYGMYVMDELADMWYEHKMRFDYSLDFRDNYVSDIQSMIRKDYNHPSVIMYSIVNEPLEPGHPEGVEMAKEIAGRIHSLDQSRPITAGINMVIVFMSSKNMDMVSGLEKQEEKKMSSDEFNAAMLSNGERMLNAVLRPDVDSVNTPVFNALDIAGYNYGTRRYEADGTEHPERIVVGSETYPFDLSLNWEKVERLPYLIGDFMWTAWDYLGELGIGSWYYSDEMQTRQKPYPWILAGAGALDLIGNPTGEALRAKAVWLNDNRPYIGVQPIHKEKLIKSAWRGTNSIPSWSWRGCEGMPTEVEVFTSAKSVRLYLNDQLIGEKEVEHHLATFSVNYQPGTLRAVSVAKDGREYEQILTSATGQLQIAATPEREIYHAGEMIYVDINIVGENGEVESRADQQLKVTVEGGELLGFGSALPYTEECFHSGYYTTYYGRSQAVIRAKTRGEVSITVSGDRMYKELKLNIK